MNEKELQLREEIASLGLTVKQKAFCEAYLEHFNTSLAVKQAGYSTKTPAVTANEMMKDEKILAYIAILKREVSQRLNLRIEDVMREYMRIGFANIDDYATWTGTRIKLKESKKLTKEQKAAVASVENTREGVKVKMHSKMDALGKLKEFLESGESGKAKPSQTSPGTVVNINEVRVALANPSMRKALDQVSSVFLGRRLKNTAVLDEHINKVTNAIIAAEPDPREDQ